MTKISDYFNFKKDFESAMRNGHNIISAIKSISLYRNEQEEYVKTILRHEINKYKKQSK